MRHDADDPKAPERLRRCIARPARGHTVPRCVRHFDKSWCIRSTAFLPPLMPTCVIGRPSIRARLGERRLCGTRSRSLKVGNGSSSQVGGGAANDRNLSEAVDPCPIRRSIAGSWYGPGAPYAARHGRRTPAPMYRPGYDDGRRFKHCRWIEVRHKDGMGCLNPKCLYGQASELRTAAVANANLARTTNCRICSKSIVWGP